ncbi:hypothetical protein [Ferrimicrobium acidiphilum]|uniref:hypothetical protein n=1 Tax=Ferrimicrobium acidiphilum TaxID=121039 RepID=UPI0023F308B0|nr:hypothetical protein [Ferrimicrobium acidiphilum]
MTKELRKEPHRRVIPTISTTKSGSKRSSKPRSARKVGSRSGRQVSVGRRRVVVVAFAVVVILTGAVWCYVGPVFRVRSILVLGGSMTQRASANDRLTEMLLHRHVWSITASRVQVAFANLPQLRGEVRLQALHIDWPSSVVVELSRVPLVGRLQQGYALTQAGFVAASNSPNVGSKFSVCPITTSTSSLRCQWHPHIGERLPAPLVAVLSALQQAEQQGSPISVYDVRKIGVVLRLSDSRECVLGTASQPRAQVRSCLGFSTPRAVLDVINPNSPAVLLNDRVG